MRRFRFVFGLGLVTLVAGVSALQNPPQPPAELKELAWLAGTWSGKVQIQPPGGKPFGETARWKVTPVLDGRYLQMDLTHDVGPLGTVRGISMLGWDAKAKAYAMFTFSNSPTDGAAPRVETVTWDGNALETEVTAGGVSYRQSFRRVVDSAMDYQLQAKVEGKWVTFASGRIVREAAG